nr:MAG TPA: hypothetical protein [Caudoviricetes sp.]
MVTCLTLLLLHTKASLGIVGFSKAILKMISKYQK